MLKHYGGFNVDIGMKGQQAGYGEETELQKLIRKDGHAIGYEPQMVIYHVVKRISFGGLVFYVSLAGRDKVIADLHLNALIFFGFLGRLGLTML
ncbi:MAG: hypothetical protein R2795_16535 [Saprospiraceae bacterium]